MDWIIRVWHAVIACRTWIGLIVWNSYVITFVPIGTDLAHLYHKELFNTWEVPSRAVQHVKNITVWAVFSYRAWLYTSAAQVPRLAFKTILNSLTSFVRAEESDSTRHDVPRNSGTFRAPIVNVTEKVWRIWDWNGGWGVLAVVSGNAGTCYDSSSAVVSICAYCACSGKVIGAFLAFDISLVEFSCAFCVINSTCCYYLCKRCEGKSSSRIRAKSLITIWSWTAFNACLLSGHIILIPVGTRVLNLSSR